MPAPATVIDLRRPTPRREQDSTTPAPRAGGKGAAMRVMPMLTEPAGERGPIPVRTVMRVSEAMPALPPGRAGRRVGDVPAFMGIVMRRDDRIFALPPIPGDRPVAPPSAAPATRRGETR